MIEVKTAKVSFTLDAKQLRDSFVHAIAVGKTSLWVVRFANGVEAQIHPRIWR